MPLGGQAGKVEDLLACPLGKVAKGPGEDGVDLAANPGKDREDGAVAEAKDEAEEIEEGDPEGEAGEWGPMQRTRLGFRDWRGSSCNTFGVGLGRFRSRFGWIFWRIQGVQGELDLVLAWFRALLGNCGLGMGAGQGNCCETEIAESQSFLGVHFGIYSCICR